MRNFILASAVLAAAASFSRAEDGVAASEEPGAAFELRAPLHGPAYLDPVFPADEEESGVEFAVTSEAPLFVEGEPASVLVADAEEADEGVASSGSSDGWLDLPR